MKKTLEFEGREMTAVCNALLPRLYRFHFGTDLFMDLAKFREAHKKDPSSINFGVIENMTWLMLKQGGEDVGETPDEWLATLEDVASVYVLSSDIMELWEQSCKTTSKPKKK